MPCELCRAYLHDYFEQPLEKDNPLFPLVSHKKLQTCIPEVSEIVLRFLFHSLNPFLLYNTKSDMENYFTFLVKPSDPYQAHSIYFQFLKRNKMVASEVKSIQSNLLAFDFLKIKRNDPYETVVEKWLAFLVGSLFIDLYELHLDHTKKNLFTMNLDKGLPGKPWSAKKNVTRERNDTKCIAANDQDDDLYT
jgi:hypothetical protein